MKKQEKIKKYGSRKVQYISAFCVSLASLTLGVSSAWSTPVIIKLHNNETDIQITEVKSQLSWMLAVNSPGFMTGSLATRFISDRFGRRTTLLVSILPIIVGAIFALTAVQAWLLYLTQFLWGTGTGMVGTVVPMYLAEIADKDIRGTLSLSTRIMFNLGNLVIMSLGAFLSYYFINYVLLVLPVCYLVACWWIPESPYFYLKEGKVEAARKELARLKGFQNEALEDELSALKNNIQRQMERSSSAWELFTGRQYRKAVIIAAGLKLTQIMTGAQTIKQYLGLIMQESKVTTPMPTMLIIFGIQQFIIGFVSTILVDRFGRRHLLSYSFLGTALSLILVGVYFFLQEVLHLDASDLQLISFLPFTGIIVSNIISSLGYTSLIFVIPAEIFPMNVKAVALTSLSIFGGILAFVTTLGYQKVKDLTGLYGVFWIFATIAVFGAIFVIVYVPETKGKSLEEIQTILQGTDNFEEANNKIKTDLNDDEKEIELQVLNVTEKERFDDND